MGRTPRFAETFCSQCGKAFGPGDSGFSHCTDHRAPPASPPVPDPKDTLWVIAALWVVPILVWAVGLIFFDIYTRVLP